MNDISVVLEKVELKQVPSRTIFPSCKFYEGREVTEPITKRILTKFNDIKVGDEILVIDSFDREVLAVYDGDGLAHNVLDEFYSYNLEYDKDDRHCWVCTMTIGIGNDIDLKAELVPLTQEEYDKMKKGYTLVELMIVAAALTLITVVVLKLGGCLIHQIH